MLEVWNSKAPYSVLGEFDVSVAVTKSSYFFYPSLRFNGLNRAPKGKYEISDRSRFQRKRITQKRQMPRNLRASITTRLGAENC